ncbi:helix-turn-helix transcriptional regulator [Pseudoalteromonas sp. T1lg24]|uniref:helix-turn-helix transcriptional regulator n=1 Tax=Pseudoalteromonas sp. T1lg24 TaxID=2077099 RepID=UPI000CF6EDD9|nr:helix-turn-helix domain-containing protein [Pseudoalteromonas sp. T1lg24]
MKHFNLVQNLRLKDAANYLGISKVTLWRLGENDPLFPPKIRLTARCCVYRKADLDAWLASKEG